MDESDGYVEVQVWRTGTDLSKLGTVTVRSRKTDPVSAEGTNVSGEGGSSPYSNGTSQCHFFVVSLSSRAQGEVTSL